MNTRVGKVTVILTLIFALVIACGGGSQGDPKQRAQMQIAEGDDFEYYLLNIEGMTCVYVEFRHSEVPLYETGYGYAGLTCNWAEWKSER